MRRSSLTLDRWQHVARETQNLLRESERLLEERVALCRRRENLLRDVMRDAVKFVTRVPSQP